MAPLIYADDLLTFLGQEADTERVDAAVAMASAAVESYCRRRFAFVEDDVVTLAGTEGRRLQLPSPPVTAVSYVAIDGRALASTEFRWSRRGVAYRDGGWGGHNAEVVVTLDHGYVSVPADLAFVVTAMAARLLTNPTAMARRVVDDFDTTFASPSGLTIGEQMVLDRWRVRTWPCG